MHSVEDLNKFSSQVRRDIVRMVHAVQSGHPGGSLGCTDFLVALYNNVLNYNPASFSMDGKNEDVFFLSNGHISPAWYSVLARSGYFPVKELATFRKLGSRLQGHPTPAEHLPGVRIASGSLGQGLSAAIGCALGKKLSGEKTFVYTLHGDGELQEGQIWEAAMYAAAKKVDNIIATIDYNGKQIDGPVDDVLALGDLAAKWTAFGWTVLEMDGHNMNEILLTLEKAKNACGKEKPVVILMKTIMGKGVSFMEGSHKWHGSPPSDDQKNTALSELTETLGDY
ncbi:MAG: transketolase [Bacteroidetes bacterium GWF2_43_63]|nr:MAG: transketolase [Bacteroidetes bacterium GWE2_42_42]OFY54346.1 MAG: transketolase [Bacteroidetes bacterium GWF2_43_63]HBG69265.1 transketolase [Bacteroidales bacterium]HCB61179.1 transketolase [Bacteroidales bacterium]HCY24099.1 transketolase [Bacteroidales bacterium]